MSKQPLLVVEHEPQAPPGWMGEWLAEAGAELDVRRPYRGDSLPEVLTDHGGMIVLGGSMDADSDNSHPWITDVKSLLRSAAADGTPTLGICLGHQLIAVALGGEVRPNPRGQQIGVLDVGWTPEAEVDPLFGPLASKRAAVQWNSDIVTRLPEGAVLLARTTRGEIQAARFGPAMWGVQWHPEAGEEIVTAWAEEDRDQARERGVDIDKHVAQVAAARDQLRLSWRGLASGFLSLVDDSVGPVPAS